MTKARSFTLVASAPYLADACKASARNYGDAMRHAVKVLQQVSFQPGDYVEVFAGREQTYIGRAAFKRDGKTVAFFCN